MVPADARVMRGRVLSRVGSVGEMGVPNGARNNAGDAGAHSAAAYALQANLVALLNDPTPEGRKENQMIYAKAWGEAWTRPVLSPHPDIPRIARSDFERYLTRIYGDNPYRQKPLGRPLAPEPIGLPDVSDSDEAVRDPAAVRRKLEEAAQTINDALVDVPQEVFSPEFRLSDPAIFESILRVEEHMRLEAEGRAHFMSSCKLHQEKLSHYLDMVEMQLARQISLRSGAFFGAMRSQDDLYDEVDSCCLEIHTLRRQLAVADGALVVGALDIPQMLRQRTNTVLLYRKLRLMMSVQQTQPTIQLLLASSDYVRALELIAATHEILHTELAGVQCFRHLGSQLAEMGRLIGTMMESDLLACALDCATAAGDGSALDESTALAAVEHRADRFHDRLAPILLGLVHAHKTASLAAYREAVHTRIKLAIKESVSNYLSSVNDDVLRTEASLGDEKKTSSLTEQMRQLGFRHWLQMLACIYAALGDILVGLRAVHSIIASVVGDGLQAPSFSTAHVQRDEDASGRSGRGHVPPGKSASAPTLDSSHSDVVTGASSIYAGDALEGDELIAALAGSAPPSHVPNAAVKPDFIAPSIPDAGGSTSAHDAMGVPSVISSDSGDRVRFLRDSDELLASAVELAHARCAKLLGVRSNQTERLSSGDFVQFFRSCDAFIAATELVARRGGLGLRGALLSQAKRFMLSFHDQRVVSLSALLREERWVQSEVASELQAIVLRPLELIPDGIAASAGLLSGSVDRTDAGTLRIQGRDYRVAGCALMFLKMVTEYCECAAGIPALAVDVMSRLCLLLKLFNTETCKLILGGGVGLKTITAKHLALTVQTLSAVVAQIPVVRALLSSQLPERQRVMLSELDRINKDYVDHIDQIRKKIVSIMNDVFSHVLKDFRLVDDLPSGTASAYMRALVKETGKLHKVLQDLLPADDMKLIFGQVFSLYNSRLQEAYSKVDLRQSSLQKRVNTDVRFFIDNLTGLGGGMQGPGNDLLAFARAH